MGAGARFGFVMTSSEIANVLIAVVAGVFSVLGVIAPIMVNKYVADASARASLSTAIQNALGAIQQAITPGVKAPGQGTVDPGVKPELAAGVDYVQNHVPAAVARFKLTPAQISDKIDAQVGLMKLSAPGPASQLTPRITPTFPAAFSSFRT